MPKKKPREFWLTKQNAGNTWDIADIWYVDPRIKFLDWDEKVDGNVIHVREVLKPKSGRKGLECGRKP